MFGSISQLRDYYHLYRGLNEPYPAIGFSVNINNVNIFSTKLYLEIKAIHTPSRLDNLLPTYREYEKYAPYWCSERESSQCVGIKITDNRVTKYLHFKFENNNDVLNIDSSLSRPVSEVIPFISRKRGVSFEYTDESILKKNYFYLHADIEKRAVALPGEDIDEIDHYEYTESDVGSKVIAVYKNNEETLTATFLTRLNNSIINRCCDYMYSKYSITPVLYGRYCDKPVYAVYWSFTGKIDKLESFLRDEA